MSEKEDPSNIHQMSPLLPPTFGGVSGLDCLRTVDALHIKQFASLSESKLF
jgi:hypothetical protein